MVGGKKDDEATEIQKVALLSSSGSPQYCQLTIFWTTGKNNFWLLPNNKTSSTHLHQEFSLPGRLLVHGSRCLMQDDLSLDLFAKLMILHFRKTPIAELFSYTKIFLLFVKLLVPW